MTPFNTKPVPPLLKLFLNLLVLSGLYVPPLPFAVYKYINNNQTQDSYLESPKRPGNQKQWFEHRLMVHESGEGSVIFISPFNGSNIPSLLNHELSKGRKTVIQAKSFLTSVIIGKTQADSQ